MIKTLKKCSQLSQNPPIQPLYNIFFFLTPSMCAIPFIFQTVQNRSTMLYEHGFGVQSTWNNGGRDGCSHDMTVNPRDVIGVQSQPQPERRRIAAHSLPS